MTAESDELSELPMGTTNRVISKGLQVTESSELCFSAGVRGSLVGEAIAVTTPPGSVILVCFASVKTALYRFGVTSPTAPVAACLSQEIACVRQFKSSDYIYSYRLYIMKLNIFYKFYVFDARSVYTETEASP